MVAHDVLDDARYAHAPPSEDADDTIKTVSYIGTDEDWLADVPGNAESTDLVEVQASHDAIAAHRLVVLAEVNTVSQDWGNLLFKLSLAEALEEVATSITEEAWLYNEYAFNISFDYIHCFLIF